jgi:hypothetical protein
MGGLEVIEECGGKESDARKTYLGALEEEILTT